MQRRPRSTPLAIAVLSVLTIAGLAVSPAYAQLQGIGAAAVVNGDANGVPATKAYFSDVAYDPIDHVYLVVFGTLGNVYGRFVGDDGIPQGPGPVRIPQLPADGATQYADQPRVAFSPEADNGNGGKGAFLVTWKDERECGGCTVYYHTWTAQGRMVAYRTGGGISPLTLNFQISLPGETYHRKDSHAMSYSPATQQFLVIYHSQERGLMGQFVTTLGTLGVVFKVAGIPSAFDSVPSIAYNATNNEFYIIWHRESYATGEHNVLGRRLNAQPNAEGFYDWADNGITVGDPVVSGWLDVPEVAWDSVKNRYLVAWYRNAAPVGTTVAAQFVNNDDTLIGTQFTIAFSGDKDRMPLGFSARTGTFVSGYTKWNLPVQPGQDPQDTDRIYGAEVFNPAVAGPETELIPSPHRCHFAAIATNTDRLEWFAAASEWYDWKVEYGRRLTSAPPVLSISSVSPNNGPATGGTVVTITGSKFDAGTKVYVGPPEATNVTLISSTQIRATTTNWVAGVVDVTVTNVGGETATLTNAFTFWTPVILTIATPANGTVTGAPAGINCPGTCSAALAPGTAVTLAAQPAAGYVFAGWEGDPDCADGSLSMTTSTNCSARFIHDRSIDFNADGAADIVWRNRTTGNLQVWYMNGTTYGGVSTTIPAPVDTTWTLAAIADFDGNEQPDLLWRQASTGETCITLNDGAGHYTVFAVRTLADPNWKIAGVGDFNGDGHVDIVWRNAVSGADLVWFLNGTTYTGEGSLPTVADNNWRIGAVADFNGDGKPDLFWRNVSTGATQFWFMNGLNPTGSAGFYSVPDPWTIAGAWDFNGDRKPDLLWHNTTTGENIIWLIDNGSYVGFAAPAGMPDVNWDVLHKPERPGAGGADMNRDGSSDIVWRNTATGQDVVWYMDGPSYYGFGDLPTVPGDWRIIASADFNGDGFPDLVWRNPVTGVNILWYMKGHAYVDFRALPTITDPAWQIVGVGDVNGDGKPDLIWQNATTNAAVVWFISNAAYAGWAQLPTVADTSWKIVAVADFNADGKPDLVWRNQTSGVNVIWLMDGASYAGFAMPPAEADPNWYIAGAADYTGDGKPDILWRNASTGDNRIWQMNGVTYVGVIALPPIVDLNWKIGGRLP